MFQCASSFWSKFKSQSQLTVTVCCKTLEQHDPVTYISKIISTLYRVQNCSRPWEKFLAGKKAMVQWIRPIFAMEFSLGVSTCVDFLQKIGF